MKIIGLVFFNTPKRSNEQYSIVVLFVFTMPNDKINFYLSTRHENHYLIIISYHNHEVLFSITLVKPIENIELLFYPVGNMLSMDTFIIIRS